MRQEGVAVVGLAVYLVHEGERVRQVALAAMGVDSAPVRLRKAEAQLLSRGLGSGGLEEIASIARGEIDPMSDPYTSAAYRKHVIGAMVKKALHSALAREIP